MAAGAATPHDDSSGQHAELESGRAHAAPVPAHPALASHRARFATRMRLDWWWIAILVLCGSFQIYRSAPIDGVFFLAAALALTVDAAGWLTALDRYRLPRVHLAVRLALGAIAVAVIAIVPQFDIADLVVVGAVGATALVVGWRSADTDVATARDPGADGARAARATLRRSAILWAGAGVFLCLWELASFFLAMPSATAEFDHPPLSDLIDPLVANPFGRAVCAALWLVAGAALLRRGRRP